MAEAFLCLSDKEYNQKKFGRKNVMQKRKSSQATKMRCSKTFLVVRMPEYNRETLEALQETLDIEAGKIPAKRYHSAQELFDANNADIAANA